MKTIEKIRVRELALEDFAFVRELAAKQSNFTIPPPYVLWLLLKVKGGVCLVAEQEGYGPLAYLLAVETKCSDRALYVWQLATSRHGLRMNAVHAIGITLRQIARQGNIQTLIFSTIPNSTQHRLIERYVKAVFSVSPEELIELPELVSPREREYRVSLSRAPLSR